jgi:hypothetical protein
MATQVFRIVRALNFTRPALSFSPHFEGTSDHAGISDRIFNPYNQYGFRIDFVWLVASTLAILTATAIFAGKFKNDRRARINVLPGIVWILAFVNYLARSLFTGVLDFG